MNPSPTPCQFQTGGEPSCLRPKTCGRINQPPQIEYANSRSTDAAQNEATASVGALIVPDAGWATAFLIADNLILTAGHVLQDNTTNSLADRQSAKQRVLVMDLEAFAPTRNAVEFRSTFALDTLPEGANTFKRRRDAHLDYAICQVAPNVAGKGVSNTYPSVPIAAQLPKPGEEVYLIHHAYFTRVKQITRGHCRLIKDQRIFVDFRASTGASGGLLVNSQWQAVGLFVEGMSGFPFGYLLGPILNDFGAAEGGFDPLRIPGLNVPLAVADVPNPLPARRAKPQWRGSATRVSSHIPHAVDVAFKGVGKTYAHQPELQWARQATCFVVAPKWILTAHHVASCPEEAEKISIDFHYKTANLAADPNPRPIQQCKLAPQLGYFASADGIESCDGALYHLDYALIRVKSLIEDDYPNPLPLTKAIPAMETELFIVQHSSIDGELHKGILEGPAVSGSTRNPLKAQTEDLVFHLAARSGGTSGSPILDNEGHVFAMHTHEASANNENFEVEKKSYNWGVKLSAVATDLLNRFDTIRADHPELGTFLDLANP